MPRISLGIALIAVISMPPDLGGQVSPESSAPPRTQIPPIAAPRPGLPPRDVPVAAKPATGRIRGRVVAIDTNAPLRRAQILLTSGQLGVRRFTNTDAEGRYEFAEVAEGRYTITASKGS